MNIQTELAIPAILPNGVVVTDRSDNDFKRVLLTFSNGYKLSVIQGRYAYVRNSGEYEIAGMLPDGSWATEHYDEEDQGDDVIGYCNVAKVIHYIYKLDAL